MTLPEKFIERMGTQLGGEDLAAFLRAYGEPPKRGLRVNTKRISPEGFKAISPWALTPSGILEEGFVVQGGAQGIGAHPYHAAGLFYMQEPSAMSAVAVAAKHLESDMRVLDMCAAPGGKSGGIAAHMRGGLLVANEIVPSRAKTLQFTLERLGTANAVVTSARPDAIASALPEYFDMILVDAPCSGEGMFRKDAAAMREWSPEHVAACAVRQRMILESAYAALAADGILIYSTCTFSIEENEGAVEAIAAAHPDMRICSMERLYPHTSAGEGHFVAALKKSGGMRRDCPDMRLAPCREAAYGGFIESCVSALPDGKPYLIADGRVLLLPQALPEPLKSVRMLTAGLYMGDMQKARFEPSHALVMAAGAKLARRVQLYIGDERLARFLSGETIAFGIENGWCEVCVDDHPIGLGKAVGGVIKNHIPKGLRSNGAPANNFE